MPLDKKCTGLVNEITFLVENDDQFRKKNEVTVSFFFYQIYFDGPTSHPLKNTFLELLCCAKFIEYNEKNAICVCVHKRSPFLVYIMIWLTKFELNENARIRRAPAF